MQHLGKAAQEAIDQNELRVSPAVVLELEYLHEIGRLGPGARKIAGALAAELGLRICDLPFPAIVDCALQEKWTRDPFDRLIVAHAKVQGAPLITKDEKIRRHYRRAIW